MSGRRQITGPAIILSRDDARTLWQCANLREVRIRYRSGDKAVHDLLTEIGNLAFSDAADGREPRQETASRQAGYMTVPEVARATRQATRTVRLACQNGDLPAEKAGGAWLIRAENARTYITAHS